MPPDFDKCEDYYFDLLGLPKDADVFIDDFKKRLGDNLNNLNTSILTNPKVILKKRGKKGSIKITPFEPQSEPENLEEFKQAIAKLWPNLQLITLRGKAKFHDHISPVVSTTTKPEIEALN